MKKKIWFCKIGEVRPGLVPHNGDGPMRDAVAEAYRRLTGMECTFLFSGWGAELTEPERAVVENRDPAREDTAEDVLNDLYQKLGEDPYGHLWMVPNDLYRRMEQVLSKKEKK